ncbi:DUF397 domain-containing protein [Actinoplanes sp. NPDC051633]|uniref:DUF397 domain-containing protein n=1 Tax=Actinoplanes sp. NPDC051633 TaxID=3155670 RepID=UPI003428A9DF
MSEFTTPWTRSTFCSEGTCVEVSAGRSHVALRDGKNVDREPVRVPHSVWTGFLQGIAAGDYPR